MVNGIWGGAAPRDGEGYAGFVVRIGDRGVRGRGHWSASGGDGCAPTQRKGWGGFGGVSSPLVLPLGGGGSVSHARALLGSGCSSRGGGGGGVAMQGKGTLQPPRVCFGVREGFCAPPLPGNPLRDVGFGG